MTKPVHLGNQLRGTIGLPFFVNNNNNNNNNNIFPPKIEGLHLKMWTHICNVRFLNHCCNIAAIFPMFV